MGILHAVNAASEARPCFKVVSLGSDTQPAEIMIYDQVGSGDEWFGSQVSAKNFVNQLKSIGAKEITVRINSNGGEILEGLAIYNAIKAHPSNITTRVEGIAASIASVIAIAGDKVCMARHAFLMIHNAFCIVAGDPAEIRKQADDVEKMQNQIAQIYAEKTGKSVEDCKAAMAEETWFDAGEAKVWGLVDEIEDDEEDPEYENRLSRMAMNAVMHRKMPAALRKAVARLVETPVPKAPDTSKEYSMEIVFRNGKYYMKIGNSEVEVAAPVNRDNKLYLNLGGAEQIVTVRHESTTPVAAGQSVEEIRQNAINQERSYRKDFHTAMAAGNITGKAAEDFEAKFYGRPIEDVKWAASLAIGSRAVAVGEGGGGDAGETPEQKKAKEETAFAAKCEAEFCEDAGDGKPRYRMWNVRSKNDPAYKPALARYIERCCNLKQTAAPALTTVK